MNNSRKTTATLQRFRMARPFYGLALLSLVVAATGAMAVKNGQDKNRLTESENNPTPHIKNLQETGRAFTYVTKNVAPAVVHIKVEKRAVARGIAHHQPGGSNPFSDPGLREFFGRRMPGFEFKMPQMPQMPQGGQHSVGQGSGFLVSEDGTILTNHHVVDGADKLTVTLADGREYVGQVVGTDSRSDVAVIKIEAKELPALRLGNSDLAEVGEWVLAIGSPFGLTGTVTSGIVSAMGRNRVGITDYENFIQTDAAINPGNSGGPLVNLNGEVIGINTAIFSRSGANNGIGFAIPINMVRQIQDQLVEDGSVTRGYLGILLQKLTPELAGSFGLQDAAGVLVGDVSNDSPAQMAGMKAGDVVVEFDGKEVGDMGLFRNQVAAMTPQSEAEIVVMREGERKTLSITIGRLPSASKEVADQVESTNSLGLNVQPLDDPLRARLGWEGETGLLVTSVQPGSPAARAGLQSGMLIQEVNRHTVVDLYDFHRRVREEKDDKTVLLRVKKGATSRYLVLELEE